MRRFICFSFNIHGALSDLLMGVFVSARRLEKLEVLPVRVNLADEVWLRELDTI